MNIRIIPDPVGEKITILAEMGPWYDHAKVQFDMRPEAALELSHEIAVQVAHLAEIRERMAELSSESSQIDWSAIADKLTPPEELFGPMKLGDKDA